MDVAMLLIHHDPSNLMNTSTTLAKGRLHHHLTLEASGEGNVQRSPNQHLLGSVANIAADQQSETDGIRPLHGKAQSSSL